MLAPSGHVRPPFLLWRGSFNQIWEQQGRPVGRDLEHWHEAERQLHEDLDAEGIQEGDGSTSKAANVTAKPLAS
jgi:hypothetical protein